MCRRLVPVERKVTSDWESHQPEIRHADLRFRRRCCLASRSSDIPPPDRSWRQTLPSIPEPRRPRSRSSPDATNMVGGLEWPVVTHEPVCWPPGLSQWLQRPFQVSPSLTTDWWRGRSPQEDSSADSVLIVNSLGTSRWEKIASVHSFPSRGRNIMGHKSCTQVRAPPALIQGTPVSICISLTWFGGGFSASFSHRLRFSAGALTLKLDSHTSCTTNHTPSDHQIKSIAASGTPMPLASTKPAPLLAPLLVRV